jgi:hypothetical protein
MWLKNGAVFGKTHEKNVIFRENVDFAKTAKP